MGDTLGEPDIGEATFGLLLGDGDLLGDCFGEPTNKIPLPGVFFPLIFPGVALGVEAGLAKA